MDGISKYPSCVGDAKESQDIVMDFGKSIIFEAPLKKHLLLPAVLSFKSQSGAEGGAVPC